MVHERPARAARVRLLGRAVRLRAEFQHAPRGRCCCCRSGAVYFALYYALFRFVIVRFDLKTPGRDATGAAAAAAPRARPRTARSNGSPLSAARELRSVDACTTRLRLIVAQPVGRGRECAAAARRTGPGAPLGECAAGGGRGPWPTSSPGRCGRLQRPERADATDAAAVRPALPVAAHITRLPGRLPHKCPVKAGRAMPTPCSPHSAGPPTCCGVASAAGSRLRIGMTRRCATSIVRPLLAPSDCAVWRYHGRTACI